MTPTTSRVENPLDDRGRELLEAALAYAQRGWKVIPLHAPTPDAACSCPDGAACDRSPGKHPRTPHGLKDATTNPAVILQWFTNWPRANVGLVTGRESGFWALDIDPRHGGDDSLDRLREVHGGIPHTVQALTGGGGEHWLFQHAGGDLPIENSIGKLGPGLDVRGDGGYIVAPPSLHKNGRFYAWEASSDPNDVPLAVAPPWLDSLVRGRPTRVPTPAERDAAGLLAIAEGTRNRSLFLLGSYMRRRGFSEAAIFEALLKTNTESCSPPMDPAEVRVIAWSSARYKPGDPVVVPGEDTPRRRVEDWPPFSLGPENLALHGLAGDVVRSIDPYTEADPVAILAHFLVFFGNVAGAAAHFEVSGRAHPARLFSAIVGDSAVARKGTSEGQVRRLFEGVDRDWSKKRIVHGLASGEGLMRMLVPEAGPDATPSDYRLLVVEPEMGAVLKAMSREGSILSMVIRQAWDTGNLEHRVSKSNQAIVVRDAHVSLIAHVTRAELVTTMDASQNTNGFANRFLWFLVRGSKMLPDAPKVPAETMDRLAKATAYAVTAAQAAQEITRTDAAAERWRELYPILRDVKPGLAGLVTSRAEAQVLRLSLLYALLDSKTQIDVVHLDAAKALWDFSVECASRIFGARLGNPLAERILSELREADNGTLTRTELWDYLGRGTPSIPLESALALLQELRFIAIERAPRVRGSKGRRPETIRLLQESPK